MPSGRWCAQRVREVARGHRLQCWCCGPPMPAPRIVPGPNGETREDLLALAFWRRRACASSSLAAVLTAANCFCALLAHLAHERKAIRRAHLADGLRIDALARRLHAPPPRPGPPWRTWSRPAPGQRVMPSSVFSVFDAAPDRRTPRTGRAMHHAGHALHHAVTSHHSVTHIRCHHAVAHPIGAVAMHERGPKPLGPWPTDCARAQPPAEHGGDRDRADHQSFLLHVRLQFLRNGEVRC